MKVESTLGQRGYDNITEDWRYQNRPIYGRGGIFRYREIVIVDEWIDNGGAFYVFFSRKPSFFLPWVKKKKYGGRFDGKTCEPLDTDASMIQKILSL